MSLPVMVHMISSHTAPLSITLAPQNITPRPQNLTPTDSFLLPRTKYSQGIPAELKELHPWERLMAEELKDFERQVRESPPMASDRPPLHPNLAGARFLKIVGHGGKGRYEWPKEQYSSPSSPSSPEWFSGSEASTSTRATSVTDGAGASKRERLNDFAVDAMDEWDSEWCSSDHSPHAPKSPKGSRKTKRRADSDEDWTPMRGGALNAEGHGHPHPDDHSNAEDEDSSHDEEAERSVTPITYMTGRRFARRRQNDVSIGTGAIGRTHEEAEHHAAEAAFRQTARWVGSTQMLFDHHTAAVPAQSAPSGPARSLRSRIPVAGRSFTSRRSSLPMRPTAELEVAEDTRSEVTDGEIWQLGSFLRTPGGILDNLPPDQPLAAFTGNTRLRATMADVEEEEEAANPRSAAIAARVLALWQRYESQGEYSPWGEMCEALGLPPGAFRQAAFHALHPGSELLRDIPAEFVSHGHPLTAVFNDDVRPGTNDVNIEEGEIYDLVRGDFNIDFEIPPLSPWENPSIPPGATPSEISEALWEAEERVHEYERAMLAAQASRLEVLRRDGRQPSLAEMCEAVGLPPTARVADVRGVFHAGTRRIEEGMRRVEVRLHERRQRANDRQAAQAEARREERRERHANIRAAASRWGRPPPSNLSVTDSRSPSTISLERVLAEEYAEEQAAAAEAARDAARPPSSADSIDLEDPITFVAGGPRVEAAMAVPYGHVEVLSDAWDNPLNPPSQATPSENGLFQGNPLRPATPDSGRGSLVLEIMRRASPAMFREFELLRATQPPRDHPATRSMTFGEHLVSGVPRNRQPSTPVMSGELFPRSNPRVGLNGVVALGSDHPGSERTPIWMRSFEHAFPTARIGGIASDQQTYIESLIHCTAASGHGVGERGGVPEGVWYVCTFRRRLTQKPKRMTDIPLLRRGQPTIEHVNRYRDTYYSDVESDEDEEFTFCEWEALFPACAVKDMLRSTDASWGVKALRARIWALEEMAEDPKSDGCCEALGEWWERVRGANGAVGDCRVRKVDVRVLEP